MAKFFTKAGILIESDDFDKIECYKSKGLEEYIENPQPVQNVEIADEYTVRPAKKKTTTKGRKKGE
jgi:hypothetical protein